MEAKKNVKKKLSKALSSQKKNIFFLSLPIYFVSCLLYPFTYTNTHTRNTHTYEHYPKFTSISMSDFIFIKVV